MSCNVKFWNQNIHETRFFVIGGAGFIGSHVVDYLITRGAEKISVFDNLSSGRQWHIEHHFHNSKFNFCHGNIHDTTDNISDLQSAMEDHDVVIHLASNPDISKAMTDPGIDFWQGTALTHYVLEAMRNTITAKRILYASGSGVYGDVGSNLIDENHSPMRPVSTYGASKLAGEGLISSYCSMFGLSGCAFRFGNVVGPRQTHGVGFDFLKNLLKDPTQLTILGDGTQKKSYIHVSDVVRAIMLAHRKTEESFDVFNVATPDLISVSNIAEMSIELLGLERDEVQLKYTGGNRGWKGDVPIVSLQTDKIRQLGWRPYLSSEGALSSSMSSMIPYIKYGTM